MAFFGIGKKSAVKGGASIAVLEDESQGSPSENTDSPVVVASSKKKGLFGAGRSKKSATSAVTSAGRPAATKVKARGPSGELNIYTAVLAAACVALLAGCVFIAMDNCSGVAGTNDEGNPFAVISSR